MNKNLHKIIALGATWGVFEATVGYLLHLLGIRIGSMIWFPIAYFFVHKAYRYTNSFSWAMLTAFIASGLKLVNLFFPGRIDMVINPAVSIVLEAFAVVLVYKYVINEQMDKINPLTIMLTGFIWRSFYVLYIFSMPQAYFDISSFTAIDSFVEFMFVKNMINIIIISSAFFVAEVFKKQINIAFSWPKRDLARKAIMKPGFSLGLIAIAVITQVFIR